MAPRLVCLLTLAVLALAPGVAVANHAQSHPRALFRDGSDDTPIADGTSDGDPTDSGDPAISDDPCDDYDDTAADDPICDDGSGDDPTLGDPQDGGSSNPDDPSAPSTPAISSTAPFTLLPNGKVIVSGHVGVPRAVRAVIAAANRIANTPYKWGGGHGRWLDNGYDCSGSVSFALHAAGLVDTPMVSGSFDRWGLTGRGAWITTYSNRGHVWMTVGVLRFDTGGHRGTNSRWQVDPRGSRGFVVRHPAGL